MIPYALHNVAATGKKNLKDRKIPFILQAQWEIATFCSYSTHAFKHCKQFKGALRQAIKERIMLLSQARKI